MSKLQRLGQKLRRDSADAMASTSVIDYLRMMTEQTRVRRRHEKLVDARVKCMYPGYEPYDEESEGMAGSILYNNVILTDTEGIKTLLEEGEDTPNSTPDTPQRPRPRPNTLSKMIGPLVVAAGLATGGGLIGYGLTQIPSDEDTDTDTVTVIGIE